MSILLVCVALLQAIPVFHWNLILSSSIHAEFSCSWKRKGISITCHIVIHPECIHPEILPHKALLSLRELLEPDLKRKLRRYNPEGIDYLLKSLWANHKKWLRSLGIAYREQQPRQSAYMICMKMCEADHIYLLKAYHALLTH